MPSHTTDKPRQSSLALIPAKQIETHLCQWCGNLFDIEPPFAWAWVRPYHGDAFYVCGRCVLWIGGRQ